ncbi:MAG: DUF1566 domain-containing protein [Tatlockia sp.]|nr:DUF1566 domain-containing protein [Tatlockia sp.]
MNLLSLMNKIGAGLIFLCFFSTAQARLPVWTFSHDTTPIVTVSSTGTATVQYTINNNSYKPHQLVLSPTTPTGISQVAPCILGPKGSGNSTCVLLLTINGSALPSDLIVGGPFMCQVTFPQGTNQCYQPSPGETLVITRTPTPGLATLSALTQNLALSIRAPGADPALLGIARIIRITNTGSSQANNLRVNATGLPAGTAITSNTCIGTLNAGGTCDITITPGSIASSDAGSNPCTTPPGTLPLPAIVTVSADNAPSTNINVLILGYGCIYQNGFLFAVDDATAITSSIGGKIAALANEPGTYLWATVGNDTAADSIIDGFANTNALATPMGQYPAAQACLTKNWYLPAICELGRYVGLGVDPGCGATNPNLYTTLHNNNLGGFANANYWSSTESNFLPSFSAWSQLFTSGVMINNSSKTFAPLAVRCIRTLTI